MSDESEHSESEFYYPGELSDAELFQLPTHYESTERNSTHLANEEVHNFLRSQQQANRRSRKQLFWVNFPIINLWNKQTVLRRNFFSVESIKELIVGQKQEENKVKYGIKVSFEFPEFQGKVG